MLIVTPPQRGTCRRGGQADPSYFRRCIGCVAHRISKSLGVRETGRDRRDDRSGPRQRLGLSSRFGGGATLGKSEPNGLIQIAFHARDVNLVMGPWAKPPVIDMSGEVIGDPRDRGQPGPGRAPSRPGLLHNACLSSAAGASGFGLRGAGGVIHWTAAAFSASG